jgi:MOSC domain-containing protein YiiM
MPHATIASIVYTPTSIKKTSKDSYDRVSAERVDLIGGHGIKGDRKAGKNPDRHLNVMSREVLDQLAAEGFQVAPGEMGEQIVVSGLDVNTLETGDLLRLGETAVAKVIQPRTGCAKFKTVQGHDPSEAAGRLGIMATVIEGGSIAVGDPVRAEQTTAVV